MNVKSCPQEFTNPMIKNEKQYCITKSQIKRFEEALDSIENQPVDESIHPLLRKAEKEALESQLVDLRKQVDDYERLRSGHPTVITAKSLVDLPDGLIKARIALGLSQKDLAIKLGCKEQQIQRYEAMGYSGASLARIVEVVEALGIGISVQLMVGEENSSDSQDRNKAIHVVSEPQLR